MALQLMLYKTAVYGVSDIGLVRQNNEDYWHQLEDQQFYVLADGMGGHQAGEVASRQAVEEICRFVKEHSLASHSLQKAKTLLSDAIKKVNDHIYKMGHQDSELKGMGTTLCCLFLHPEGLLYAHVGDSRIYRMRKDKFVQLTEDHSLVRELIDLGQLSKEQAGDFQYRNIITKAIGTEAKVDPSIHSDSILKDDVLMMCTDGLTDILSDQEMQHIIALQPVQEIASLLVKSAVIKGGFDNVTVVIVKIQDIDASTNLS